MKIGFISRYPPVHCGIAEYTRMLISGIRSISPTTRIYVFSTTEAGEEPWVDELTGARVIPSYPKNAEDYEMLLENLRRVGGVDVIHVQHEYGIYGTSTKIIDALREAKEEKLARASIITTHTVLHEAISKEHSRFQRSLDHVDIVVVHSILQEFELQAEGIEPSKIKRIPHGTLVNPYLGQPRHILAKSIGLREEDLEGFVVALPGFLREDKGLDMLLEALTMVKDKLTVIVAGEITSKTVLEILKEASYNQNIILIEKYLSSDEILRIVALADALVLPYKDVRGKYSVSGILHLSMGGLKPILGTRVPRLVELYQFAPRLTVPPYNPSELAKRITWLIQNYDYAVAYMATLYGYAARTQWVRIARRHLELYKAVVEERVYKSLVEPPTETTAVAFDIDEP